MSPRRRQVLTVPTLGVAAALAIAAGCSTEGDTTADTAPVVSSAPTTSAPASTTTAATPTAPLDSASVTLREWAEADAPTAFATRPGDPSIYVAERAGRVVRFSADGSRGETVLDLTDKVGDITSEQGLLGIAWHPGGEWFVVSYTDGNDDGASVIERHRVDGDSFATGDEVLRVAQPAANHNGGNVAFGPDSLLYIGLGDGGGQGDPDDRAQDLGSLLGKVLRIDITTPDAPYGIPGDNPFADGSGGARREIWLSGVRNPWRFSFDSLTGDLWIADVGANAYEEINQLRAVDGGGRGANLGWDWREGRHDTSEAGEADSAATLTEPIAEYGRDLGASITGGVVMRTASPTALEGAYLYSDFVSATLWALRSENGTVLDQATLDTGDTDLFSISTFGQGPNGEVFIASLEGQIWRIDVG